VFNFEQTHLCDALHICRPAGALQGGIVAVPKIDKHKDYVRYATHCLEVAPEITDRDHRAINREMATEWLALADAIIELSKPIKRSA
jgi:hypothetical protein